MEVEQPRLYHRVGGLSSKATIIMSFYLEGRGTLSFYLNSFFFALSLFFFFFGGGGGVWV